MKVELENDGDGMTNFEIIEMAKKLKLPNFKYRMRDELIQETPLNFECGIINLDNSASNGTHHCCWWKDSDKKLYFDSYGCTPPRELVKYLKSPIMYSTFQIQTVTETNCSEYCLHVLNELNKDKNFIDIILAIVNDRQ